MEDLYSTNSAQPLAVRMRPQTLDELVGQEKLVGTGTPLRNLIEGRANLSIILWGPPGTGKTTLAYLVSKSTGRRFKEISAVAAGVKDVRAAIDEAKLHLATGVETVLFVDEVHRFSKAQQDILLPAVENRWVSLVAATTENPSFSVIAPLLSRSLLLTLHPLTPDALETMIERAIRDTRGLDGSVQIDDEALAALIRLADGDGRRSLTLLEAAASSAKHSKKESEEQAGQEESGSETGKGADEPPTITLETLEQTIDRAAVRYDRDGDQHYDIISAYIKSIRGSDPDAALHYLARMIEAGEDPRFIARRLMVHASEDIGIADPTALTSAVNASHVVEKVGLPEARIALAQATIHLSLAPKSNATIMAIDTALADVRSGKLGAVPAHLRDGHYPGAKKLGHGEGYKYPHSYPDGVVAQEYAPESIQGQQYYHPKETGMERQASERLQWLRKRLRRR